MFLPPPRVYHLLKFTASCKIVPAGEEYAKKKTPLAEKKATFASQQDLPISRCVVHMISGRRHVNFVAPTG